MSFCPTSILPGLPVTLWSGDCVPPTKSSHYLLPCFTSSTDWLREHCAAQLATSSAGTKLLLRRLRLAVQRVEFHTPIWNSTLVRTTNSDTERYRCVFLSLGHQTEMPKATDTSPNLIFTPLCQVIAWPWGCSLQTCPRRNLKCIRVFNMYKPPKVI